MTATELKKRAIALAEKTKIDSVTPEEVGQLSNDIVEYIENVEINGSSLGIRKTYTSVSAMEADSTAPKDDKGVLLRRGMLVNIYNQSEPDSADNGKVFSFQNPGWAFRGTVDAGYATKEELTELDNKKYSINKIYISGKNLFDISQVLEGYVVEKPSGIVHKNPTLQYAITSGRIPISAGATYTISGRFDTDGAVGYDVNGNKVKIFPSDSSYKLPVINGTFIIPTDSEAVEMQITCRLNDGNDISQLQIEEGNEATEFEPYRRIGFGTKLAEIDNRITRLENLDKIVEYTSDNFDTSDNGIWYQSLSPSIGNKVIKSTNGNVVSLIGLQIPTKKGDTWLINLLGGAGTGRGYFVTDGSNTILELAEPSFNCLGESYKLEINYDNAEYLYVNCQKGTTDNSDAFKVILLNTKVEIEELDKRVSVLEKDINTINEKKTFKFLLIGSSFGVNTIIQFPFLAKSAGVEITCGNLYKGGVTLEGIKTIIDGDGNFETGRIFKPTEYGKWENDSSSFEAMLTNYDWDVISLQRSADDRAKWDETQINNLEYIINYIRSKTLNYNPKIVFNTIFSTPVSTSDKSGQIADTENIISTALKMQDDFGLEIIPTCTAVQNARNTELMKYGFLDKTIPDLSFDGLHLDFGVGSYITGALLFEYFFGKRFDMSVLNVQYIPTKEDVDSINITSLVWPDKSYTQPTEEFIKIAKYCAMTACRNPYEINTSLGVRFPYLE